MKNLLLLSIIILAFVLRVVWLDRFPVALYTDEADQAYNAVSVLQTGKDEHGAFFPVSLRSFGDWKPPLQTYLMIPFFALRFPVEYSTRLPGALLGTATVALLYSLMRLVAGRSVKASLLGAWCLAISPWHILQSRSAMLVAPALFCMVVAVVTFYRSRTRPSFLLLTAVFCALAVYGYYGMRVVIPLLLLFLIVQDRLRLWTQRRMSLLSLVLLLALLLPLGITFLKQPDVVFGRARTVSVFYDQGVRLRQWELITQDGMDADPHLTNFFHTSVYLYARSIASRFLSHFDGNYLFFVGDRVQPFQISHMGIFYLIDSLFLIGGSVLLWADQQWLPLAAWWIGITILPAALTYLTPSSNRTFFSIIPLMTCIAVAMDRVMRGTRRSLLIGGVIAVIYMISFSYFLHQYYIVMPRDYAQWWNAGWKDVVDYVNVSQERYQNVVIAEQNGMPYIYFLLYGHVDPGYYQTVAQRTYVADEFGFEHVAGFGKYIFLQDIDWKEAKEQHLPHTLYVIPAAAAQGESGYTKVFYYPDGTVMAKLFAYD